MQWPMQSAMQQPMQWLMQSPIMARWREGTGVTHCSGVEAKSVRSEFFLQRNLMLYSKMWDRGSALPSYPILVVTLYTCIRHASGKESRGKNTGLVYKVHASLISPSRNVYKSDFQYTHGVPGRTLFVTLRLAQGYALVVIASDAGRDRLCRSFNSIICVTLWMWKQ